MKTTATDILIETIQNWGSEVIFGLPGDGIKIASKIISDKARELA